VKGGGRSWRNGSRNFGGGNLSPRVVAANAGTTIAYNAASTAFATSAVPLLPPNSVGLMPPA
jgi:hypothetical protein